MIIFFSMGNRCGFCVKAEQLLKNEIDNGKIIKKSASEANGKFSGFPAFENTTNGKTHMGCPSSVQDLYNKLQAVKENYTHSSSQDDNDTENKKCTYKVLLITTGVVIVILVLVILFLIMNKSN